MRKWGRTLIVGLALVIGIHIYGFGMHLVLESTDPATAERGAYYTRPIEGGVMSIDLEGRVITDCRSSISSE